MKRIEEINEYIKTINNPLRLKGLFSSTRINYAKCINMARCVHEQLDKTHPHKRFQEHIWTSCLLGNHLFGRRNTLTNIYAIGFEGREIDLLARVIYQLAMKARYTRYMVLTVVIPALTITGDYAYEQPGFIIDIEKDLC